MNTKSAATVQIGSRVRFTANGVEGIVFNVTKAYNTGETTVQWSDGENACHHALSKLTVVTF